LNEGGEDTLLVCEKCGYRANRQVAMFARESVDVEAPKEREEVATPNCKTIEDLCKLLDIPASRTAKAVFYVGVIEGEERFVFAVVRGDHELNDTKLANAVKAQELRPATEEEIRAIGAEP